MTAALVERMAQGGLWELFQRVVPPAPERPQGAGGRRRGNREVLAAIIFAATSGCTRNRLPPGFGRSLRTTRMYPAALKRGQVGRGIATRYRLRPSMESMGAHQIAARLLSRRPSSAGA
ncbi:transposase [Streptomyces sp. NPDC051452]|uniref:transposase n=1 Tax=Streptomyces sp. NPDC051452 TaxID=3365654 RepID=UPI00379F3CAC